VALKFLSYRARSEAEVKSHVRLRGYTAAVIESVVKKLRVQNVLDDETFAQNWTRSRCDRGYGPKRIEQELRAKGIDRAVIREAIGKTFDVGDEKKRAKSILEKRFNEHQLTDPKVLRRAIAFLQRRGFNAQLVYCLLRNGFRED